ncbi:MAG: hypothetical protein LBI26_00735 [Holosporales bacterium]|jgi:type VI secretion system protein ImpL|nr:hypothetical protein [Holosporales bacterium]
MASLTLFDKIVENLTLSLPALIGIVLSAAFVSMLAVTIWTIISMKKAEAKKAINLPPSAMQQKEEKSIKYDLQGKPLLPLGESINKFLIVNGYIKVHNTIRSFFKSMDFMRKNLGTGYKYKLPWFMVVGASNSGKSSLLSGFTHDEIFDDDDEEADCTWWFLRNGVVLDIKGETFLPKEGSKADNDSWDITLSMLSRYRSERPLNGILLTIPATELYGKNRLSIDNLKSRAQYIARKLNFAQNFLGMKLPIYVVVTKTDIVPGFQSFCSEIPVRNRNNMLGWSCPYSLESIYNSRWIDDAFESIEDELNEIRMEIFSEAGITTTRDGVFVFPSELLTIKENLRIYIDYVFRSGSTEERFYFRGMYFTGDSKMVPLLQFSGTGNAEDMAIMGTPDADVNEAGNLTASLKGEEFAPKKIFFFEDLLLKKIFIEDGIASPMKRKIHQSNKSILIAKFSTAAFVAIGSYGLFHAREQLRHSRDMMYPSLFKVSSLIKSASNLTMDKLESNGNEILSECTNQLFIMMQQLNNIRFSSMFVPASWFSSINTRLIETLRISYQRVVVRTIYMNLILKARNLFNTKPHDFSKNIGEVLNPYKSREYKNMKKYVDGLIELDKNIKKFDSLRSSGDPKDLNDLVDYTFKGTLPSEFLDNYEQFRSILMNTPFPPINLSPYKKVAYDTLINLFQTFLDAVFSDSKTGSIIYFLNDLINSLSKQNIQKIPDCKKVVQFSRDITEACKEIGNEGETWLDTDTFKNNEEYNNFLDGVEQLFGKDVAQYILDVTASKFETLKLRLDEFNDTLESDISGHSSKKPPLSHGIFKIEKCLAPICKAPYMQESEEHALTTDIPEGKMVYWDDELIQYAYEISKTFEQFLATSVKEFPRFMQEGITLMAKSNFCNVVAGIVGKAQSFVDAPSALTDELTSEELLQKQVSELRAVAPKFVSLLNILRNDKLNFVFSDLRTILNKVGFSLLSHIQKLLDNQNPYMPQNLNFSYWDGELGASYMAYSIDDSDDMKNYIVMQRKLITRLALDFAEPIVLLLNTDSIFDQNFGNHGELMKWVKIVDAVKRLKAKDPTCPINIVEKFITKDLNSYNLENITKKVKLDDIKGESSDYFINLIKKVKRGILARGEVLVRQQNIKRYNVLKEFYDKKLNGKYPFTDYDKTTRVPMAEADTEDVREFFRMYDEYGGTPENIFDQIYQLGDDAKDSYNFLKKIHDMRLFFGDFAEREYESPKVRLTIDFNINKKSETGTGYLMDRIFKPNNDANIEAISENKSDMWYLGEAISMNFRWGGGNDPDAEKPVSDTNDPDLIVEGDSAKVECIGNWSVLRFLQKYKIDLPNSLPNQTVLAFKIPLNNGKQAKIHVGITASRPPIGGGGDEKGSGVALVLPQPIVGGKMPELDENIIASSHSPVIVEKIQLAKNIQQDSSIDTEIEEVIVENKKLNKDVSDSEEKEALKILEGEATEDSSTEQEIEIVNEPIG